ncbi:DUF3618 domain-containing protein [Nocardioides sp. BP30]|uniref:DUF3618 domain-containing protein n=1 Tax=Nocardioides sp. BP30 TaxID=3036374 RepID=UPI002469B7EA|nr:DUF3618 domain-containing protein [Nocardioides sp. BP30]WGL53163.1 DUF3618 domain-containing protein [Nocardioides sp. BP30]
MTEQNNTPQTPEELRADIERTRAELADTVGALTERLDVKGRAQARADELAHDPRARGVGVGLAVAAVLTVAFIVWRKRR